MDKERLAWLEKIVEELDGIALTRIQENQGMTDLITECLNIAVISLGRVVSMERHKTGKE